MSLIENIQREDLNPIEEAIALQRLQREFDLTQQQVADAVGKNRTTVTNLMRLMSLREDVRTMVEHGDLEMGHGKALLGLPLATLTLPLILMGYFGVRFSGQGVLTSASRNVLLLWFEKRRGPTVLCGSRPSSG